MPDCPWPEEVFVCTVEQYVAAVPDDMQRTAISGLLMRMGWNCAMTEMRRVLESRAESHQQHYELEIRLLELQSYLGRVLPQDQFKRACEIMVGHPL